MGIIFSSPQNHKNIAPKKLYAQLLTGHIVTCILPCMIMLISMFVVLLPLITICFLGLKFFPLLACVEAPYLFLGHCLGFLYSILWLVLRYAVEPHLNSSDQSWPSGYVKQYFHIVHAPKWSDQWPKPLLISRS